MNALGTTEQATIFLRRSDCSEDTEINDQNDVCMKAAIASFQILSKNKQGSDLVCGKKPQIVLHLRDLSMNVKYETEDGCEVIFVGDKQINVVFCAIKSVLQILHKAQCLGKDSVAFQSRKGTFSGNDLQISNIKMIHLNQNNRSAFSTYLVTPQKILDYLFYTKDERDIKNILETFCEGIISHTYAYLEERKLCLFLNYVTNDTLIKIDNVLANLFPRFVD